MFTVIVAFFQLADSPTFRTYMWQPISQRGISWSADDWSALGYNVFGLIGGVFLIVLVWRGLALRALGSYLWFLPLVFIMVLSFYRHAKWMSAGGSEASSSGVRNNTAIYTQLNARVFKGFWKD